MRFSSCIEPISCDEAFIDITGLGDPEDLARTIRSEIQTATQCTASAGIGPNKLLAKIATTQAKPNGQRRIQSTDAIQILTGMDVGDIPGAVIHTDAFKVSSRHRLVTPWSTEGDGNRKCFPAAFHVQGSACSGVWRENRQDCLGFCARNRSCPSSTTQSTNCTEWLGLTHNRCANLSVPSAIGEFG